MTDLTHLLASTDIDIAVVGATDSPGKYGGIIYRDLKGLGYRVRAVNPNRATGRWRRVLSQPRGLTRAARHHRPGGARRESVWTWPGKPFRSVMRTCGCSPGPKAQGSWHFSRNSKFPTSPTAASWWPAVRCCGLASRDALIEVVLDHVLVDASAPGTSHRCPAANRSLIMRPAHRQ